MRPALAALAEQQKIIDRLVEENSQLKSVASRQFHDSQTQARQIKQLTRGLSAVAQLTGLDTQVRTAIFKRADEQNPAQPIPDPAPEGPVETTAEAATPEAYADVRAPGLVPGTNNDVPADATTTAYTPGQDVPSPAINQLIDVTRPIDGTQGPRPLGETKTQVDVRVGDPMNAQVAFPVNGPFANAQRTSSMERTSAALHLAKLRIATGTAETDDDTVLFDQILKDASLSDDAIEREIETLKKFENRTASHQSVDAPTNVVPRSASVRTTPQFTSKTARTSDLGGDSDAEVLFLGDFSAGE